MFSQSMNIYSILSFNKDNYSKVIKNIEKSRGFISYIDSSKKERKINPRYEKYIESKQALYTARPPYTGSESSNSFLAYKLPEGITEENINSWHNKYGISDDYYIHKTLIEDDSLKDLGARVSTFQAIPIESDILDLSTELDTQLQLLNQSCLSSEFILHKHRRFFLLPFIAKKDDKYVEPIVIANVYSIGIITIQLILDFEHKETISLTEGPPRDISFPLVDFYKIKSEYKFQDFWEKETKKNLNVDSISEYYEKQLSKLCGIKLHTNPEFRSVSWALGDFSRQEENHLEFIKKNKRLYFSLLTNSNKEITERQTVEELDKYVDNSTVTKTSEICYFCSPITSVFTIGHETFLKKVLESLGEHADELKQQGIYEEVLNAQYKKVKLVASLQCLRFYELTFIKRYFLKELLNNISKGSYKKLKDYDSVKKELNFIKLQYDEEILFFTEGSPKELYKSILDKTNVDNLLDKVEDMVKSVREDVSNFRERDIKKNETLILILSSILAILLGYRGLKYIVEDILINLNLPIIGILITNHPLRTTIIIWSLLVLYMLWLNVKRWFFSRK
ncbi:hypothetical protein [Niallia sp. MER 6]|uniref:hypothetical protein n=1 Tax=Niallia sp. MER 6 TaxID=2939567 RepID=UPI00203A6409|nr:hypothetical protein [Niallia sp. MER 6]MCM3032840.1 hypothetical protein [Niallia sp. MER 6]